MVTPKIEFQDDVCIKVEIAIAIQIQIQFEPIYLSLHQQKQPP